MKREALVPWAFLLLVSQTTACGGALSDARADFGRGRYAAAKSTLVPLEVESRLWSSSQRAAYATLRGLTHLSLGDRAAALVWLREARALEAAHPGSLDGELRKQLELGLESLGEPWSEQPPPP